MNRSVQQRRFVGVLRVLPGSKALLADNEPGAAVNGLSAAPGNLCNQRALRRERMAPLLCQRLGAGFSLPVTARPGVGAHQTCVGAPFLSEVHDEQTAQ